MSECFTANELKLYIDKTNLMHFKLTFSASSACQTSYCEANVKQAVHMKFLVLHLDNHMNWKTCIDKKISELSRACYVIRFVYFLNDVSTSKTVMPTSAHWWSTVLSSGANHRLVRKFPKSKKIIWIIKGFPTWISYKPLCQK